MVWWTSAEFTSEGRAARRGAASAAAPPTRFANPGARASDVAREKGEKGLSTLGRPPAATSPTPDAAHYCTSKEY